MSYFAKYAPFADFKITGASVGPMSKFSMFGKYRPEQDAAIAKHNKALEERKSAKKSSGELAVSTDKVPKQSVVAVQDNQLVTACYRMTLTEKRLLLLGISKVDSERMPSRSYPLEFDVSVAEWAGVYGDGSRSIYKELFAASKRLLGRQVFLKGRSNDDQLCNWLDRCQYHPGEGRISIRFGWTVSHYLSGLFEQFTKVDLLSVRTLSSFHSVRLYELLSQFRSTGFRVLSLSELRAALDLGASYPLFADVKRRIIDPSVLEINEKTDFLVSWSVVKEGKKVVSLRFVFEDQRQGSLPL